MKEVNQVNRNKYALITGATSGFGYELSRLFAKDSYNLVLVARGEERLQEIANELKTEFGIEVTPLAKDLFRQSAPKEIYDKITEMGVTVDVLVNDAGQGEWGKFSEIELQRSLDIIQLNIGSLVSLTKYFLTDMIARGEGKILQVGSEAGKTPMPLLSVYAATKAFVLSFSAALTDELKDTGVTVTVLLPGAADTDFFHKAHAEDSITYRESELQTPEEVAKDGYEALMRGESKVISGAKTKMHVFMANVTPDETNASKMRKQMELSDAEDGRSNSMHPASSRERMEINKETGTSDGDYKQ